MFRIGGRGGTGLSERGGTWRRGIPPSSVAVDDDSL